MQWLSSPLELSVDVKNDYMTVADFSLFDRDELRALFSQVFQDAVDVFLAHMRFGQPAGYALVIVDLQRGEYLEGERELQRRSRFRVYVLDNRLCQGLEMMLRESMLPIAIDEFLGCVTAQFRCKALLDDAQRHLAGAKAGHPDAPGILLGQIVDLAVNFLCRNFHDEVSLATAEVNDLYAQLRILVPRVMVRGV